MLPTKVQSRINRALLLPVKQLNCLRTEALHALPDHTQASTDGVTRCALPNVLRAGQNQYIRALNRLE